MIEDKAGAATDSSVHNTGEDVQEGIAIPHKAIPSAVGKVYYFHRLPSEVWEFDAVMEAVLDSYLVDEYLDLIAHELSHTRIAMEEAEYPTPPSVLILRNTTAADSITPGVQNNSSPRSYLRTRILKSNEVRTIQPYGGKTDHEEAQKNQGGFFSEKEFLSRVKVDAATNVHYLDDFPVKGGHLAKKNLEAAQKFFDVVLISPLLPTPFADNSVTKHYGLTREYVRDAKNRVSKIYVAGKNLVAAAAHAEKKPDDLIVFDIIESRKDDPQYEHYVLPASVVRASVVDIIKDMFGVYNPTPVMTFVGKVSKRDKKAVTATSEAEFGEIATIIAFAGIFGSLIVSLFLGFDFSGTNAIFAAFPGLLAFGFSGHSFNTWLLQRRRINKLPRTTFIMGKKIEERAAPLLLPYTPVHNSIISGAYNRRKSLSVKVERVNADGWNSTEGEHMANMSLTLLQERISKLKTQWMEYELDPVKALDYPLMLDATCKYTATFLRSMNDLAYAQREIEKDPSRVKTLADAVATAEEAFYAAESYAKKKSLTLLTQEERGSVMKARKLAEIMKDKGSTPHEKRSAYQQANKLIDGILPPLSSKVIGLLEA